MSTLSIITVNYNNLEGLKRTVESVVNQTWREFEYIVIDGGSTDGSAAYIESQNENIDYWVSESDSGIYNAMNKGIKVAKGEYLLFLNSGDILVDSDVLENIANLISEKLDIYYGNLILSNKGVENKSIYPKELTFSYFYHRGYLPHPASFIKRNLFEKISYYNENFKIVSDWEFFVCAICKHNASYKHLDVFVTNYNTSGISSKPETRHILLEERRICLKNNFPLFIDDNEKLISYNNMYNTKENEIYTLIENNRWAKKLNMAWLQLIFKIFGK